MNVLEKILKEVEDCAIEFELFGMCDEFVSVGWIKEIIRSYMNEVAGTNISVNSDSIDRKNLKEEIESLRMKIIGMRSGKTMTAQALEEYKKSILRIIDEQPTVHANDNWIPVSERLPEPDKMVVVTVHCSEWISDYDSVWVSEDEKIHHSEEYLVSMGYVVNDLGDWAFFDLDGYEIPCDKEFGTDKGDFYSVVTAWRSFEELKPYKGGE